MSKSRIESGYWSVTVRGKDGNLEVIMLQATDRADVFRQLEARHLSAIKVEQSAGKPRKQHAPSGGSSGLAKGLVAAVVVVGGALVAWLLLSQNGGTDEPASPKVKKNGTIAVVTPSPSSYSNRVEEARKKLDEKPNAAKAEKPDPGTNIVWLSKQRYEKRMANGAMVTVIVDNPDEPKPIPVFESGLNNFMTNFLIPGDDIPETPIEFTNEEIMSALMEKIEIKDDDDEDVRFKKESIAMLREQLVDYIKEGKTARDFIYDLQRRQQSEAAYVSEARNMIFESLANDTPQEAKELYEALNKHMNEKGLPNVRLPRKILKRLEEVQ